MAVQTNFKLMEKIADQIGAEAALRLCGFFGGQGRAVYVPLKPTQNHIIEKIIGPRAYADLCAAFPGEVGAGPFYRPFTAPNRGQALVPAGFRYEQWAACKLGRGQQGSGKSGTKPIAPGGV